MEKSTIIGIVLGLVAVIGGMFLKNAPLAQLINPAAYVIILVGTAASLFIGFPMSEIKKFPKLIGIVFKQQKLVARRVHLPMIGIARPAHHSHQAPIGPALAGAKLAPEAARQRDGGRGCARGGAALKVHEGREQVESAGAGHGGPRLAAQLRPCHSGTCDGRRFRIAR